MELSEIKCWLSSVGECCQEIGDMACTMDELPQGQDILALSNSFTLAYHTDIEPNIRYLTHIIAPYENEPLENYYIRSMKAVCDSIEMLLLTINPNDRERVMKEIVQTAKETFYFVDDTLYFYHHAGKLCEILSGTDSDTRGKHVNGLCIMLDLLPTELASLCGRYEIDFTIKWENLMDSDEKELPDLVMKISDYTSSNVNQVVVNRSQYTQMPRTYRVAALWALIEYTKCCPNIDRVRVAEFIEAVTGGNISVKPKDTVAYKQPERTARKEAANWLSKIGIDTKE